VRSTRPNWRRQIHGPVRTGRPSARKILKEKEVHLVVLDIKLKGESGLQILQEITREHRSSL